MATFSSAPLATIDVASLKGSRYLWEREGGATPLLPYRDESGAINLHLVRARTHCAARSTSARTAPRAARARAPQDPTHRRAMAALAHQRARPVQVRASLAALDAGEVSPSPPPAVAEKLRKWAKHVEHWARTEGPEWVKTEAGWATTDGKQERAEVGKAAAARGKRKAAAPSDEPPAKQPAAAASKRAAAPKSKDSTRGHVSQSRFDIDKSKGAKKSLGQARSSSGRSRGQ